MIFSRRALQNRLDQLRVSVGDDAADGLVPRLNKPNKHRLAAAWELAVLESLSQQGRLRIHEPLPSGRTPDITFEGGGLEFTADITAISDEGLDIQNPVDDLLRLIEATKKRMGLTVGGVHLQVGHAQKQISGGKKRYLKIPNRGQLSAFLKTHIEPEMRRQHKAGVAIIRIQILDDEYDVNLTIDPSRSPFNTAGYIGYAVPTVKNANPLFNALTDKARQLKGAIGLTGIIIGDGDSTALKERRPWLDQLTSRQIAEDFLRQHRWVHFVWLLTVREKQGIGLLNRDRQRRLHADLVFQRDAVAPPELLVLFDNVLAGMPVPVIMPINASPRSSQDPYDLGFHGGCTMSHKRIKVSAREVLELLAGTSILDKRKASDRWRLGVAGGTNPPNPFWLRLQQGHLPTSIRLVPGSTQDADDWIEFEFGPADPAISPFK